MKKIYDIQIRYFIIMMVLASLISVWDVTSAGYFLMGAGVGGMLLAYLKVLKWD